MKAIRFITGVLVIVVLSAVAYALLKTGTDRDSLFVAVPVLIIIPIWGSYCKVE